MSGNQNRNATAGNIMQMFNPAAAAVAPAPQQPQQQPTPQPDQGFQTANGGVQNPQAAASGQAPAPATTPFDGFSELFKIDEKAANPLDAFNSPVVALDATKLQESVAKMNFAGSIDPQKMQAALQGNTQAFAEVMNGVAQSVFARAAQFMQQGMEGGFQTYHGRMNAAMPEHFKRFAASQELSRDIPHANHAAVQPMVQALQEQFMRANPNLPPAEVAKKVRDFLGVLGTNVAPKADQQQAPINPFTGQPFNAQQAQGGNEDWDSFFR